MAKLGKFLTNPWVLAGGVAFGLVLLLNKSSGGGSSANASAQMSYAAAVNSAAMDYVTNQAAIAADVTKTRIAADAQTQAIATAGMMNLASARISANVENNHVNAGIVSTALQNMTAIQLDRQSNANRIAMAYVAKDTTLEALKLENGINRPSPQLTQ